MLYYAMGTALVTRDELVEKAATGALTNFANALRLKRDETIDFSTGIATTQNLLLPLARGRPEERTKFTPVGMGTPLTIELRHVYTGDQPRAAFLQKKKDMIVTSSMKGFTTYTSAPRAVNMLEKGVTPKTDFKNIAAPSPGTPLIFYVPAVTEPATALSVEVMFDNFPDQVFTTVGNAFTSAAGIPIFASASVYLIAAGMITKLLGAAGHGLFDGHTGFRANDTITFARPGAPVAQADYRLLTQSSFDEAILQKYQLNLDGVLVDDRGKPFAGNDPYVVISLDGAPQPHYNGFVPTAATAGLLDQFFTVKDGVEQSAQSLIDAMKIYSDWIFRGKADKLKAELDKMNPQSEEYKKKKAELDAAIKNIISKELQP